MLGALNEARNSGILRKTLATYVQHGLNASAAAKSLGINDRTVAYRLKVVEDVTGHSFAGHRFEFEAALRLERILRNAPWPLACPPH